MRRLLPSKRVSCDLLACLLCVLHWVVAVTAVSTKSPTFDEPTHFAAGYSYWLRNDYRLDPEAGVLSLRLAALPMLVTRPAFPPIDAPAWKERHQGDVGTDFLYVVGNDADSLLLRGRMVMALVSAILCGVIYLWSRSLFGNVGGLISVTVAAFCPTFLAHGPLVTADVTAALFFLLSSWALWQMLHAFSLRSCALAAGAVAGLLLSKMSGVIVIVLLAGLIVCRVAQLHREGVKLKTFALQLGASLAAISGVSLFAIWAAYGFRYSAATRTPEIFSAWPTLLSRGGLVATAVTYARAWHLLPEAYLYGFTYTHVTAQMRPAFLDGNWSITGFGDFFPRAFLYKTPLATLAMLGAICVVTFRLRPAYETIYRSIPLLILIVVYGSVALTAHLNIGHRHILPLYAAIYVLLGGSVLWLRRRCGKVFIAIALTGVAAESLAARPDYLSYFNLAAGGAVNGYKHLVDSSLDWGQDLPSLAKWLQAQGNRTRGQTYLAYFGTADPKHYGVTATEIPAATPAPLKGGTYCISATNLQHVYSRAMGGWALPYETLYRRLKKQSSPLTRSQQRTLGDLEFARLCAALRCREPDAEIGSSILIYKLSDVDVTKALEEPPPELLPSVMVAGLER